MSGFFCDPSEISGRPAVLQPPLGPPGCGLCLLGQCKSPRMEPFGQGRLEICIVGQAPGEQEDIAGRPFIGPSGQLLSAILGRVGVDRDRDCWMTNVIQCILNTGTSGEIAQARECCASRLRNQLLAMHPRLILVLGGVALRAFFNPPGSITSRRGLVYWNRVYGAWVAPTLHPAAILRSDERQEEERRLFFQLDIERALRHLGTVPPDPAAVAYEDYSGRFDDACAFLQRMRASVGDRKSTRLNSSHTDISRMPSSA